MHRVGDNNRVVLVTGASTGIGLALAHELRHSNFRVVVTARQESLQRFFQEGFDNTDHFLIRPLDVTDFSAQAALVQEIYALWGSIDILVNNAAFTFRSVIEDMSVEEDWEQFQVNYFAPMHLIRLVLPIMRKNHQGHIINISSVGGMMAMPTMGAYSASKFALEAASEALWYEMLPWGVRVNLIEPGFIHSDSFLHTRFTQKSQREADDWSSPYFAYYANMGQMIEWLMNRAFARPEDIAQKIIRVMHQKKPALRVPATIDAWAFHFLRRILPRGLYHRILFHALPHIKTWVQS